MARRRSSTWKEAHARTRKLETQFARRLRKVAYHVGELIDRLGDADPATFPRLQQALENYSRAIEPWAEAVVNRMHADVGERDLQAWIDLAAHMREGVVEELRDAPTGWATQTLLREQVGLITSIPTTAAERVHEWTLKGLSEGVRYEEVAEAIRNSTDVSVSRANLIARTEVARTASVFTQARAQYVGSDSYVWRTSGDADVRPTHRKLANSVQRWDKPPECDPPHRAHAGQIYNCRCYPEPIVPE
jgi:SPP1 gp7 family putative phage head morphogenesis protein